MEIDLRRLQKKIKEYDRVFYIALSVFFFLTNYHICYYFYPLDTIEHVRNWWHLKVDIYVLIISLCYLSLTSKGSDNKRVIFVEKFIIHFGVGFAFSNSIDRWFFDDRLFSWNSYFPLIIILIVSYYSVKKLNKTAKNEIKNLTNEQ